MRTAHLYSLAVPALLGAGIGLLLMAGHKDKPAPVSPEAALSAQRRIHVESYRAESPKAPMAGKLETMSVRPAADTLDPVHAAQTAPPPVVRSAPKPDQPRVLARSQPQGGDRQPRVYRTAEPGAAREPAPAYDASALARSRDRDAEPSDAFGFRVTVPVCRRAAQQGDPLGDTPQCREMLDAAREQQRRCEQAWEEVDDRVVMSAACRQAARFR